MTRLYNLRNLWLVLLLSLTTVMTTQAEAPGKSEFKKTIKKEFDMNQTGELQIVNKYGQVDINTWDKSQVKIKVTIIVYAGSQDAANATFERIAVDFSNGSDFVKAITNIESRNKDWSWKGKNHDFKINYEVFMPAKGSLDLSNKYGNATIASINGNAKVNVKYGNFQMNGVGGNCGITLGYGNGTVTSVGNTDIDVKYSKLRLGSAADVNVNSKYSKVYIDGAKEVKSSSKYDTYMLEDIRTFTNDGKYDNMKIKSVDAVRTSGKYSEFEIDRLHRSGNFSMQYGEVTINKLMKGFSDLDFQCKHTDIEIIMDSGASCRVELEGEHADFDLSADVEVTVDKKQSKYHEIKGTVNGRKGGMIKAKMKYGDFELETN